MPRATATERSPPPTVNGATSAATSLAATRSASAGGQERAEQHREVLVVDRGDDVAGAHAGAQADRDLAAQQSRIGASAPSPRGRQAFDPKAEHRHRRRLALAQGEQLAQVLDQLRRCGRPVPGSVA